MADTPRRTFSMNPGCVPLPQASVRRSATVDRGKSPATGGQERWKSDPARAPGVQFPRRCAILTRSSVRLLSRCP
jgi:hypothetical protein